MISSSASRRAQTPLLAIYLFSLISSSVSGLDFLSGLEGLAGLEVLSVLAVLSGLAVLAGLAALAVLSFLSGLAYLAELSGLVFPEDLVFLPLGVVLSAPGSCLFSIIMILSVQIYNYLPFFPFELFRTFAVALTESKWH